VPKVIATPDNLDELNPNFLQRPLTNHLFLNSVPKSGSHLLKNIFRMFVPLEQQYNVDFIQYPTLKQHHHIFLSNDYKLSWGHLLFGDNPAGILKNVNHILLVRDPYDWVVARARFFLSENFQADLEHLKYGRVSIDDFLNMMIFGIHNRFPTMEDIFLNNAVAWLGTSIKLVHYEDIIKHLKEIGSPQSKAFFEDLLGFGGMPALASDRSWVMYKDGPANRQASPSFPRLAFPMPDVTRCGGAAIAWARHVPHQGQI